MPLRFGDYSLDAARRELKHRDTLVAVEPQVFDLLLYLVHNRDRVVSKDDCWRRSGAAESCPNRP